MAFFTSRIGGGDNGRWFVDAVYEYIPSGETNTVEQADGAETVEDELTNTRLRKVVVTCTGSRASVEFRLKSNRNVVNPMTLEDGVSQTWKLVGNRKFGEFNVICSEAVD